MKGNRKRLTRYLAEKQGMKCFYCGCPIAHSTRLCAAEQGRAMVLEHYLPKHMGGQNNEKDCVASCRSCDVEKGALHGNEYLALKARQNELLAKANGVNDPIHREKAAPVQSRWNYVRQWRSGLAGRKSPVLR